MKIKHFDHGHLLSLRSLHLIKLKAVKKLRKPMFGEEA